MSREKFSDKTIFIERLRLARVKSGLSHDKIGEIVACSGGHLANIEAKRTRVGKRLQIFLDEWIRRVETGEDYTIPIRPVLQVTERETAYPASMEISQITRDLRRSPSNVQWVLGLLKILKDGGEGRSIGIQENIKAFLGDMEREGRKARDAG